MNAIERIEQILREEEYPVNLTRLENGLSGPLIVSLRPDDRGREMVLLIESLPPVAEKPAGVIGFSLVLPYFIPSPDPLPELFRTLFVLNRLLPIGSYGFCEQTLTVFFHYNLLVKDARILEPDVIRDAVGMIGLFTRRHGQLIDKVLSDDLDCDTLLYELEMAGGKLEPLLSRTLRAG